MNTHRRLEIVFDIGNGPRVLAFVDFSADLSFGIPKCYKFTDYTVEPKSENYERTTIHSNGLIKTHFPLGQGLKNGWDGRYAPLAKWHRPWSMFEELSWGSQNQSIRDYLANPKDVIKSPGTFLFDVTFPSEVKSTQIRFSVLPSLDIDLTKALGIAPEIVDPTFCTWVLVDSWPYVLISMRYPPLAGKHINLNSIGRDYRLK